MKTFNLKTISVFVISVLLFGLLASCSNKNIETVSIVPDSNMQDVANDMIDKKADNPTMMDDTTSSSWLDDQSETMMEEETKTMDNSGETMSEKLWVYTDYSPEALANATWKIVLFFHANWCPTCISIEKDILANDVPSDLTILKVDYDTANDLKQRYSVLTQSSFVQVDHDWNMIKRWISWRWLNDIVKKVE